MYIAVYLPKSEIAHRLQVRLAKLGVVRYTPTRNALSQVQLNAHATEAQIIAIDPDNFGGFELARDRVTKLLEANPQVRYIALLTTSYGWLDLQYCHAHSIMVSNVPSYSREAVAEHTLGLLLCLAKHIIRTDRKTRENRYELEMGFELAGKTLGIIGLGNIGSRVAQLGHAIGMDVIAYNPSPRSQDGVRIVSLKELLNQSDAVSIHVRDSIQTHHMLSKQVFAIMKRGVIIVNTARRDVVNEEDMANALRSGQIGGYAYEGEDLKHTPLTDVETAIGLKGFGWYTREAIANLYGIAVKNIESYIAGRPMHLVDI